ncbi:hypothetical protein BGY98DRAFT_121036 [Russula aff. rugulosa BPL654]|nr:hypothetical protein BGY98DRAFT_121036 [Russula aff. rugulosa BPL654]
MWLDHWDIISKAYARTGALKTYFTRAVKLTHQGAVNDLKKSVLSYLKNNPFPFDGARQDAYDLMTGAWIPRKGLSALFLITDTRPFDLRAVGSCVHSQDMSDYGFYHVRFPIF